MTVVIWITIIVIGAFIDSKLNKIVKELRKGKE